MLDEREGSDLVETMANSLATCGGNPLPLPWILLGGS
jgi:hypothetical protein